MLEWASRRAEHQVSLSLDGPHARSGMLTIFSIPKAFNGHIGVIQRNAIRSWMILEPRPEILLLGNESGIAEAAEEFGAKHIRKVATNKYGTPLMNDAFRQAIELAGTGLLCLTNCDIVLLQEFADAVKRVAAQLDRFLAVTHRLNVQVNEELNFSLTGERKLRDEVIPVGIPGNHTSIDVFVFPAEVYCEVPALILGRGWFDQWLIKNARVRGIPVVDVTPYARAIHQDHDYGHVKDGQRGAYWGEEALYNLAVYGGKPHAYTLLSATHELRKCGELRRVRLRRLAFTAKQFILDLLVRRTVRLRDGLRLRRKFWRPAAEKSVPNVR